MTRSFAARTWARSVLIGCLSIAGWASGASVFALAADWTGAQSVPSPQPPTQPPALQSSQDVTTLELGKPIEREIAGSQKHAYQIALAEGEYANVTVRQRGVDVVVKSFGPDGKLIAEFRE